MRRLRTGMLLAPGTLWLAAFFVVPMLLMLAASVLSSAVPIAPPICWDVLTIAEATPLS